MKQGQLTRLFRSPIATLLLSSVTAQLVPVITMPVLSRLFTPHEFGVLGVYRATVAVLSVAGCLRLEHGVLIEPDEADANALARRCFKLCFAMGILAIAVLGVLHLAGPGPQAIGLSPMAYYAMSAGMVASS